MTTTRLTLPRKKPESLPFVIGLTGPGGCGKSTVANAITWRALRYGWRRPQRIHTGEPLKAMLREFPATPLEKCRGTYPAPLGDTANAEAQTRRVAT